MIKYDKIEILEQVILYVKENLSGIKKSAKNTKERANDAPGAMVSHSDTSKTQLDNLAMGLKARTYELEIELENLENFTTRKNSNVSIGALIKLEDSVSVRFKHCYILPAGAGTVVDTEKGLVNIITTTAPLFNAMKGLEIDAEFYFKRGKEMKEYCITDIL
ncbi:MAG: hypothetical protein V1888_03795 [archaeon]